MIHRDERAQLAKLVVLRSSVFKDLVEMEKSTLSARSRKLFTLSAIYSGNNALLDGRSPDNIEESARICATYWDEVGDHIPEWKFVRESKMTAGEVRRDFLHSHAIVLQALGIVGNWLLQHRKNSWQQSLKKLNDISWSRSNARIWEGRAMIGGRVSKAAQNVTLTTNFIKISLNIPLSPEENRIEQAFMRGNS